MLHRVFASLLVIAATLVPSAEAAAESQSYSLLSPAVVASLASQRNTPLGQRFIHEAYAHLTDTPHARARLHTEGTLPHQGIRDESLEAAKDFDVMAAFGFAYRLTNDKRYLDAEDRFLSAWSQTYQVSFNPIDETRFEPVFVAFDLTRSDLPTATQQHVVALFRGMATGYLDWEDKNGSKDIDNWNSHRIKHAVLSAYLTGDPSLITRAAAAFSHQVKQNIRPDGSVDDFYKRDALHYVTYDLEPLTIASLAAKAHGEDWFRTAKTGKPSVEMAVDWLIPYATGEKTHQEFAHSTVKFDADRDKAGEHGYSGAWEPAASVNLFTLASWQDSHYAAVLTKICTNTSRQPTAWVQLVMNGEAK
jgi:Alginate lyase